MDQIYHGIKLSFIQELISFLGVDRIKNLSTGEFVQYYVKPVTENVHIPTELNSGTVSGSSFIAYLRLRKDQIQEDFESIYPHLRERRQKQQASYVKFLSFVLGSILVSCFYAFFHYLMILYLVFFLLLLGIRFIFPKSPNVSKLNEQLVKWFTYLYLPLSDSLYPFYEVISMLSSASPLPRELLPNQEINIRDNIIEKADFFISHAWSNNFFDAIETLKVHFEDEKSKDPYIWMDIFCHNQNLPEDLFDSNHFNNVIGQIKHTVLVLGPLNKPIPFTRVWCFYEIFRTVSTEGKFDIAVSDTEKRNFLEKVKRQGYMTFITNDWLEQINFQASTAKKQADEQKIKKEIQESGHFCNISDIVKSKISDWIEFIMAVDTTERSSSLAEMLVHKGRYSEALSEYKLCYEKRKEIYERYPPTIEARVYPRALEAKVNVVRCYYLMKQLKQAEQYARECLIDFQANEDSTSSNYLTLAELLGLIYCDLNNYEQAVDFISQVIEKRALQFDEQDPITLRSIQRLGQVYVQSGRFMEAKNVLKGCLTSARDSSSPLILDIALDLAEVYRLLKRYSRAQKLLSGFKEDDRLVYGHNYVKLIKQKCFILAAQRNYLDAEDKFRELLAKQIHFPSFDHPENINSIKELANLYYAHGKYLLGEGRQRTENLDSRENPLHCFELARSQYLFCFNLAKAKKDKGEFAEPEYLKIMHNLGCTYINLANLDLERKETWLSLARSTLQECHVRRVELLSDKHPDTLTTLYYLAQCHWVNESPEEFSSAEKKFIECLELRKKILPNDHIDVLHVQESLAALYYHVNNQKYMKKAEKLLKDCIDKCADQNHPLAAVCRVRLARIQGSRLL